MNHIAGSPYGRVHIRAQEFAEFLSQPQTLHLPQRVVTCAGDDEYLFMLNQIALEILYDIERAVID